MPEIKYQLINPHIEGDLKTTAKARSVEEAAGKIYHEFARLASNNLDHTYMTLMDPDDNLYHVMVKEKSGKSDAEVDYTVRLLEGNMDEDIEGAMIDAFLDNREQTGGKGARYYHSDDDEDVEEDLLDILNDMQYRAPIMRYNWRYAPYYLLDPHAPIYRRNAVILPNFSFPRNPRVMVTYDFFQTKN